MVGDTDDSETMLAAAQRELEEETGYTAREWHRLPTAYASPGLTDEAITFFLARGLTRVGAGGGVESESIRIHEVALDEIPAWLEVAARQHRHADMKIFAGLYAATA